MQTSHIEGFVFICGVDNLVDDLSLRLAFVGGIETEQSVRVAC